MIRRSFRIGLWLGVLTAVVMVLTRGRRRPAPAGPGPIATPPETWPPITPAPAPAPPAPVEIPVEVPPVDVLPVEAPPLEAEPALVPEPPPLSAVPAPAPPAPPRKAAAKRKATAKKVAVKKTAAAADRLWVEPSGNICPETHPVKAKLSSRLFHLPGGFAYARTNPDRCYTSGDAATTDGFTPAKR